MVLIWFAPPLIGSYRLNQNAMRKVTRSEKNSALRIQPSRRFDFEWLRGVLACVDAASRSRPCSSSSPACWNTITRRWDAAL